MSKEMLNAFAMLEEQKGIKSEIVIEAIEQAITAAYKRQYGQAQNVKVIFDEKKGNFNVYSTREVVDEVFDSRLEISLEDAHELNPHYEIGDKIMFEEKPKDFARTAAGAAKQVIMQKKCVKKNAQLFITNIAVTKMKSSKELLKKLMLVPFM